MAQVIEGVTGVVLAGGRSRRFGSNKALADWKGEPMAAAVFNLLKGLFRDNFVVVKKKEAFGGVFDSAFPLVEDIYLDPHPLGGVITALARASTESVFVCACDMPFVRETLVRSLCARGGEGDAVIPLWEGVPQPLCGLFSRPCLPVFRTKIQEGDRSVVGALRSVKAVYVREDEMRKIGETGISFQDIDTPEEFARMSALR